MTSRLLRPLAAFAAVGACAAIAACTLTTSLSGLIGPPENLPTDAGVDSPTLVGASDAGDGGDGLAVLPYCATLVPAPAFCDDFERTEPKGAWSKLSVSGGGAVTTEPSTRGAGRELRTVIPVFGGGGFSAAKLEVASLDVADEVTVSYALRIEAAPEQNQQQIMAVTVRALQPSTDVFALYLFVRQGGISLVEHMFPTSPPNKFIEHALLEPISFGAWHRIEMTATLSAPPHLRLRVDGKLAFDGAADPFFRRGQPTLNAGVHYTDSPSGPLALRIDDVAVTLK